MNLTGSRVTMPLGMPIKESHLCSDWNHPMGWGPGLNQRRKLAEHHHSLSSTVSRSCHPDFSNLDLRATITLLKLLFELQ